ncbi:MAG: hypothetical protein CVV02_13495 [Firmicutes bacterium HGW-Firmicutes-7]|nr:MAG: hypothetical protein CVV02_13495 [Firmicutes bacterium HGW-Firmicutes-7]
MKNTQTKAIVILIMIMLIAIIAVFISLQNNYYASAFVGMFLAVSCFVIVFLFLNRYHCMAKMLSGTDLVVSWIYSDEETKHNIKDYQEATKGRWIFAVMGISFVAIIVSVTVSIAAKSIGVSLLITIGLILMNVLLFKLYLVLDEKRARKGQTSHLKPSEAKKKYVYISSRGIYAHGMLNVWKGWGSRLRAVQYEASSRKLAFTYSYLRSYTLGWYKVEVYVPDEYLDKVQNILVYFTKIVTSV